MKSKLIFVFIGLILLITLSGVADEGANPFNPIFSSTSGGAIDAPIGAKGKHPLQQYPVKNYVLMGVIASSKRKVALIRAKNGEEYFVEFGCYENYIFLAIPKGKSPRLAALVLKLVKRIGLFL